MSDVTDRIEVVDGDITRLEVDAIVNAANESLLGGGGVDGAIHRAAGPELLARCRTLGGCPTGEVRITPGFQLPARLILHTVGPVWQGGERGEEELLASCYRTCLAAARTEELGSVAFPCISTGVYGFPLQRATRIAVGEIRQALAASAFPGSVILVCFGQADFQVVQGVVDSVAPSP